MPVECKHSQVKQTELEIDGALGIESTYVLLVQVEGSEVKLRRSVGLKKDEYQLNRKHITWVQSRPPHAGAAASFGSAPWACMRQ